MMVRLAFPFILLLVFPSLASAEAVVCNYSGPDGTPSNSQEWRVFLLHKNSIVYQNYDADCDGALITGEVAKYAADEEAKVASALHSVERHEAEGFPVRVTPDGETVPVVLGKNEPEKDPCAPGWRFLLRESYEDVTIFTCPKAAKDAKGAQFDWGRDEVSGNDVWSAKGVAAIGYSVALDPPSDPDAPYVVGYAFAPSVSFNRVDNSLASQQSKDVDILSFAATGELALGNALGGTQYLRMRPAYNTTFAGDARSWQATAEWQPYWITEGISISVPNGIGPFTWELDPIARLIYSEQLGAVSWPIFEQDESVLRLGGVLALTIKPKQNDELVPRWLQPASFSTTYEWLTDVESGRDYSLLTAGLNFALDKDGHTALKLSYTRGDVEESGQFVDQAKFGIAAKW